MSLRLGRSSTLRDNDITVPRPQHIQTADTVLDRLLPMWVEFAVLQGRVYDEVYSPGAFLQPEQIRYERARTLVSEITRCMEREDNFEVRINYSSSEHIVDRDLRRRWIAVMERRANRCYLSSPGEQTGYLACHC